MKTKLTKSEYLQLQGLLSLAQTTYKSLTEIETAAEELLGVDYPGDHCSVVSDAIYGIENFSAKKLCRDLDIAIER